MAAGDDKLPFNGGDRRLLHDIDKRLVAVQVQLTGLQNRIERVDDEHVSKDEFKPVAHIAFGIAATVLLSVIGALLWLVIKQPAV